MNGETRKPVLGSPGFYLGMIGASVGVIGALATTGLIEGLVIVLLAILPAALLIPLVRTARHWKHEAGTLTPALRRYNWRMMTASIAYALGMGGAVWISDNYAPGPALSFAIALLPTVPALGMIGAMVRYMIEETDEYLRHRASLAALIGLGLVLALGTIWGFLETFGLVVNIWAWWVVPVWAMGLGIGQIVVAWIERKQEQE